MAFLDWFFLALAILQFDAGAAFFADHDSYLEAARHLYSSMIEEYKTAVRPAKNSNEAVTVDLSLSLLQVDGLDEKNQAFTISGYMHQEWTDFGLVWNPEDYGDITSARVPLEEIWYPDIVVFNSMDANYYPPTHHMVYVNKNGTVRLAHPVNIKTHCVLDVSDFPFDEHVCTVVFGSWSFSGLELNLTSTDGDNNNELRLAPGKENLEWKLVKFKVQRTVSYYSGFDEPYPDIGYIFTVRRRSTFATHLFVGPSVMLCLVTPAVFLMPPGSGEKMLFGMGILIADTLLLGELLNYMPTAHPNLPFIAKYFLANIVLASLSLAISAIIVGFWDKSTTRLTGPPAFFRLLVLSQVATLLCVKKEDTFSTDDAFNGGPLEINPEGEDGTESTPGVDPGADKKRRFMSNYLRNAAKSEWRQLAVVFDRLFFLIYCVILAFLTLSFARFI